MNKKACVYDIVLNGGVIYIGMTSQSLKNTRCMFKRSRAD